MTVPAHRPVELLAPAGGPEALVAAVNNGADAVYLGLSDLNARRGAGNFDLESLGEAARFAHLRGARVYLTANVVILPEEMARALALVADAWAVGVDAVIVQDLGLLDLVAAELPEVRIHASTQADAMNPESVALLGSLGASRVTLARELTVDAIAACARAGVEVEAFVHGAICNAYSGQCLMSSMIGRRSANRGLCAQPCRLPYELVGPDGPVGDPPGRYLLSPKDMAGIAHLPALIEAGVRALKIEGRMKSPEYVAIVTRVYRGALDRALADPGSYAVTPGEWELLEEAFSRGLTDAYLTDERGAALMSYTRPNNRGVLLGRVVAAEGARAEVELERALDARDRIEVWTRSGRFAQTAGVLRVAGAGVAVAPAGAQVALSLEQAASVGDRVFRVTSATLEEAARRTFTGVPAIDAAAVPVNFRIVVRQGRPLTVTARSGDVEATAEGPLVESARTKAITADEVIEHVGRLGGSGFRASGWDVELEAGVGVGYSALHGARREALVRLEEAICAPWAARTRAEVSPPALRPGSHGRTDVALVVVAWDARVAAACLDAGADVVHQRVWSGDDALASGALPALSRVVWPAEVTRLRRWLEQDGALVANLGLLPVDGHGASVDADWPLNVVNPYAAAALARRGAGLVWASPELSGRQLAVLAACSPVPTGVVVWGRAELMVTEQCVLQAAGPCGRRCGACPRRDGWWSLVDRKGYSFPVTTDPTGRSHIVNAVTLDLTRALVEIVEAGVAAVRADFTDEDPDRAAQVVHGLRAALDRARAGLPQEGARLAEPSTSGHFFRGLL